jgi:hypothetical protein
MATLPLSTMGSERRATIGPVEQALRITADKTMANERTGAF